MVDDSSTSLAVWAPQAYPNIGYHEFDNSGAAEDSAPYLLPKAFGPVYPESTWETEAFFCAGHHQNARESIYDLQERLEFEDRMFPYGFVDTPGDGEALSGVFEVTRWAIDDRRVTDVGVLVGGEVVGAAEHGLPRDDVAAQHPGVPGEPAFGYRYSMDASVLPPGAHQIEVMERDSASNTSNLLPAGLTVTV